MSLTHAVQLEGPKPLFLKNTKNGRVFPYNEIHAKRADFVPCDAQGTPMLDTFTPDEPVRVKSTWLGNPENGRLFRYTDILAKRPELVSIENEDNWYERYGNRPPATGPVKAPIGELGEKRLKEEAEEAARLQEEEAAQLRAEGEGEVGGDHEETTSKVTCEVNPALVVPSVDGMPSKAAKDLLAGWAKEHHDIKIDKRDSVGNIVEYCNHLTVKAVDLTSDAA